MQSPVIMAAAVPNSPETCRRMMCVTPPISSIEMREELTLAPRKNQGKSLRKVLIEDEDIVKQDFTVSCDRVGRFVSDKELQIVRLYVWNLTMNIHPNAPTCF